MTDENLGARVLRALGLDPEGRYTDLTIQLHSPGDRATVRTIQLVEDGDALTEVIKQYKLLSDDDAVEDFAIGAGEVDQSSSE